MPPNKWVVLSFIFFFSFLFSHAQSSDPRGILISDYEYQKVKLKYTAPRVAWVLPKRYSIKKYAPKPLNQFEYSTSPAWAASYAAFTIVKSQQLGRKGQKLITRQAFSPLFPYFYSLNSETKNCSKPVSIEQILTFLKEKGTPRYREFPVRCVTLPRKNYSFKKNKIAEYARIFNVGETDSTKIIAIKRSLASNLPVIIGMHVSKSFNYAKGFWRPTEKFNANLPSRAFCVVSYDDTKFGGAFEIMNSEGASWGNGGFMWIPYNYFISFTRQAYNLFVIPDKNIASQFSGGGGGIELEIVKGRKERSVDLQQLHNGHYKVSEDLSGLQLKIKILNNSIGFLYVFSSDLTNEVFELFPPHNVSAIFTTKSVFYVPDEYTILEIDETIGVDYLCVLFSKKELDMAAFYEQIKSKKGNFEQKVSACIADKMTSKTHSQVKFNSDKAYFTFEESNYPIVKLIIEYQHNHN